MVPAYEPLYLAPIDSQLSSNIIISLLEIILLIFLKSLGFQED